jgi:hypothetical protein
MGKADASGVCLHLSSDAFVVWEDKVNITVLFLVTKLNRSQIWAIPGFQVCRGVIASPFKIQAFELPFDRTSPVRKHTMDECGTTYPSEEDMIHIGNPITGLSSLFPPWGLSPPNKYRVDHPPASVITNHFSASLYSRSPLRNLRQPNMASD